MIKLLTLNTKQILFMFGFVIDKDSWNNQIA